MASKIQHTGVVLAQDGARVQVRFTQQTSCASCQVRSMCLSSESKEREVWAIALTPMSVGDHVMVEVTERLAWRAVLLAYGLPLVLMMGVLMLLNVWLSEAVAGTIALVSLAAYYLLLATFRPRLQRTFDFTATKQPD